MTQTKLLVAGLEGILIPPDGKIDRQQRERFARLLVEHDVRLVIVSDQNQEFVRSAIIEFEIPSPDWIVCDSGATICENHDAGNFTAIPGSSGSSYVDAVAEIANQAEIDRSEIVVCTAKQDHTDLLTSGLRSIVVANVDRSLARSIYDLHRANGICNNLYFADSAALAGLLEGCRWFEMFPPEFDVESMHDMEGATPVTVTKTHFRVWAPLQKHVSVHFERTFRERDRIKRYPLKREPGGYFGAIVPDAEVGMKYSFRFMNDTRRPDPRSALQPETVHGPSQIVSRQFPWQDNHWRGIEKTDLIIYELHIGTFTDAGTFDAAIDRLPELVQLGVTTIELLPVCQTPGRWNWGYDGANLFAVRNSYGGPDALKRFVDACHRHSLAVIMDVVYNHMGPEGNYLPEFGPYFSRKHHTPWGPGLNYDGPLNAPVRQYVIDNACYWIDEFHCDGLRLDAIHFMFDDSDQPITMAIREVVMKLESQLGRKLHLIGESNLHDDSLLNPPGGQQGYDAIWCDDFMHALYSVVTPAKMTNRAYHGARDVAEALQHGFLYEGAGNERRHRESPLDPPADRSHISSLVIGIQTHDMIGNHPHASRLGEIAGADVQRAAAALSLLYPAIPILFMGEEFASSSPFHFFVDFGDPNLQQVIANARAHEHPQHIWKDTTSPIEPIAFSASKLPDAGCGDESMLTWYRQLLAVRKKWRIDSILNPQKLSVSFFEESSTIVLSYISAEEEDRVFVASRICSVKSEHAPVVLDLSGDIILDSRQSSTESVSRTKSNETLLFPNHAIVGVGRIGFFDA